jgi:hypothetical protein
MHSNLSTRSGLVISFAIAAAGVIALGAMSYRATVRSLESSRSVAHTREVASEIEKTLALVEAAETSQRAYMITGQPGYAGDATAVQPFIEQSVSRLQQLCKDPQQRSRAVELRSLVARKIVDVNLLLQVRQRSGFEAARDLLAGGVGKNSMDAVRAVLAAMKERESALLDVRSRRSDAEASWNLRALGAGLMADVALLLAILALLLRDLRRRGEVARTLVAARDEAIGTAETRSRFLSRMSHQVRTPLNAILGFNGLLLASPALPSREREFAERIGESGDLLLSVVNEILDVSKLEAGQLLIEPLDFDLRETVESVVQMFSAQAQAKGLEIGLLWDHELPEKVRGDAARIRQILMNLIASAVKFTEKSDVIVSLNSEARQGLVRFSVTDTGVPLSQRAAAESAAGTGLGHVLAESLTQLLGGTLTVESGSGPGSTAWFAIPLAKPVHESEAEATPRDDSAIAGLRVLVVDDAQASRRTIRHNLAAWRIETDEATGAEEALAMLRGAAAAGRRYDLALIDSAMPDIDGLVLSRLVKADRTIASTRIILLTSLSERAERGRTLPAGIEGALTKPPRQSALFDAIVNVFCGPAIAKQKKTLPSLPRPLRAGVRILVVEDNSVNQRLAILQLESLGFRADTAADGAEGLEALARIPYDLVLMDCQMPVLDGFKATRELRLLEGTGRRVPVIAMTANALGSDRQQCLDAGMDDYISKPVNIDQLGLVLDRWLPEPADSPLDQAVLDSLRKLAGTDQHVIADLVSLYAGDSANLILEIQNAVDARNAAALSAAAHALKSSSGSIGAKKVGTIAASLEKFDKTSPLEGAQPLLDELCQEHSRALVKLKELAAMSPP